MPARISLPPWPSAFGMPVHRRDVVRRARGLGARGRDDERADQQVVGAAVGDA